MGWLDNLFGWSGLFTLIFQWEKVLMILAGVIVAAVSVAALRSRRRWWLVLLIVLGTFAVVAVMLAVALKVF